MKSYINAAQAVCLSLYASGDFEHLLESPSEDEFKKAVEESGDGLLRFLMTELATSEGCDSITEAMNRVHMAIEDLQGAKRNLEKELDKLSDTHVRVTLVTRLGRTGQFGNRFFAYHAQCLWHSARRFPCGPCQSDAR